MRSSVSTGIWSLGWWAASCCMLVVANWAGLPGGQEFACWAVMLAIKSLGNGIVSELRRGLEEVLAMTEAELIEERKGRKR